MTMIRSVVCGTGMYLPPRVIENSWFEDKLDTSDEWIRTRSGIERRHFADVDQPTSDLALHAARAALDKAGLAAADIDGIVLATSTPDRKSVV